MKLATVQSVRTILGFEDMTDINNAIAAALEQATPILEGYMQSYFGVTNLVDRFFVPEHQRATGNSPAMTRLRLSSGMVQNGTITTKAVGAWEDLAFVSPKTTMKPEQNNGLARGVLIDTDTTYGSSNAVSRLTQTEAGPYIQVEYTCGFAASGTSGEEDLYDPATVPEWLKTAARLNALITLENHPVVKNADIEQDVALLKSQLSTLLTRYKRYAPSALLPL